MGKRVLLISLSCLFLGLISSDTAVLMNIATTTAAQLNELETLISKTEKHTKQLRRYSEIAEDEWFRAQGIVNLSQDILAAGTAPKENLGDFNAAIRNLKSSMESLKSQIQRSKEREKKRRESENFEKKHNESLKTEVSNAKKQKRRVSTAKDVAQTSKYTAQNTAQTNLNLLVLRKQANNREAFLRALVEIEDKDQSRTEANNNLVNQFIGADKDAK